VKRALLGGTFDPVHMGHLLLAQEMTVRLELDEVWFVPAGVPWMKQGTAIAGAEDRRKMVEIAIADNPRFHLSTVELDRPGETYTVDTLEELRVGPMSDGELLFVMGVDTLHRLHEWKAPARLLELAKVVVVLRPGHGELDLSHLEALHVSVQDRVVPVPMPLIEISGTELRRRVRAGEPVRYLVPDAVAAYIEERGLYLADE
jgi:nicotinate-nucleotide adenylyltransferase